MTRPHRLAAILLCAVTLAAALPTAAGSAAPALAEEPPAPPDDLITPASADPPPMRSTFYDGTNITTLPYAPTPEFNIPGAMTVEAWVRRADASRCETVIARSYQSSYWLGFCNSLFGGSRLRFYRGGGTLADASRGVPAGRWTHVAVTFTPGETPGAAGTARFYIDGEPAGTSSLAYTPDPNNDRQLILGKDPEGFFFSGQLDEVRLWSVARTAEEIRNGMFREIRAADGLVAAFGNGGDREEVRGLDALVGGEERVNGILPRELTIPLAATTPAMDGDIRTDTEYLGAEQLVIRYPIDSGKPDAVAYLVATSFDLHVGVSNPFSGNFSGASLRLMVDPDRSGGPVAQTNDFQVRVPLTGDPASYHLGRGDALGFGTAQPVPVQIRVAQSACAGDVNPLCSEIRVDRALLGGALDGDGLALGLFNLSAASGAPGDHLAPANAQQTVPDTWAAAAYSTAGVTLPRASFSGRFRNVAFGRSSSVPITGVAVYNNLSNTLIGTTSGTFGDFTFSVPVPPNVPLRLEYTPCAGCRAVTPLAGAAGIPPTQVGTTSVIFPGCARGTCQYAAIDFNLWEPTPEVAASGYTTPVIPPIELRVSPSVATAGQVTRISGTNLHPWVEVWAAAGTCLTANPTTGGCTSLQATVIGRDPGGTWVDVALPVLPVAIRAGGGWRLRDGWDRPTRGAEWRRAGANFTPGEPEFPLVRGLGFDNIADGTSWDEYTAVFGWNTYACLGIRTSPETCLGARVPDPHYLLYFGVYGIYIGEGAGSGSCAGMAATSLLFEARTLRPETFDANVRHPAGFTQAWFDAGQRPARWNLGALGTLSEPAAPGNLWAEIRKNHGTQASAEFFQAMFDDIAGGGIFSVDGNPRARLEELRSQLVSGARPMICLSPGLGGGHCVTPYAIEDLDASISRIKVYDNNWPNNVTRFIEVNRTTNRYRFALDGDTTWEGTYLITIPQTVYRNPRSAPGLEEGARILWIGTFGSADARYSTPAGEWGWRADGTFVDSLPGAVAGLPFSTAVRDRATRQVPLLLPIDGPAPAAQLNARGGSYTFHAAQGGQAAQLQVPGAAAGAAGDVQVTKTAAGELGGFRFTPARATEGATARLAMTPGAGQRVLLSWGGLRMDGGAFGFEALPDQRGAVYRNGGAVATRHTLTLQSVDEAAGASANRIFGPFDVPAGGVQRVTVADWPAATQLRVETDANGDGAFEDTRLVGGAPCALRDADGDGAPVECVAAQQGVYLPLVGGR